MVSVECVYCTPKIGMYQMLYTRYSQRRSTRVGVLERSHLIGATGCPGNLMNN